MLKKKLKKRCVVVYDKIYKEIFLKDYITRKKKVYQYSPDDVINKNRSIWEIYVYEQRYFITVYFDDIDVDYDLSPEELNSKKFEKRNEAELTHFRTNHRENSTKKRIIANRLFLELLRKYAKEAEQLRNML